MGQAWGVVTPSMRRQCAIDTTSAPGGFEGEGRGRRSKGGGWVGTNRYPRFNCFFLLPTDFQILRATKGFGGTDATKEPSKSIRQETGGRGAGVPRVADGHGLPRVPPFELAGTKIRTTEQAADLLLVWGRGRALPASRKGVMIRPRTGSRDCVRGHTMPRRSDGQTARTTTIDSRARAQARRPH